MNNNEIITRLFGGISTGTTLFPSDTIELRIDYISGTFSDTTIMTADVYWPWFYEHHPLYFFHLFRSFLSAIEQETPA